MDSYPTHLSTEHNGPEHSVLKRTPEESGQNTPSHGGMVTGMEYDMAIATKSGNRDPSPLRPVPATNGNVSGTHPNPLEPPTEPEADPQTSTPAETSEPSAAPIPRPLPPIGSGQRPASMPPQPSTSATIGSEARPPRNHEPQHRSKQGGRVLGSYTMTKTLGAGSMGKVKLAVHNHTSEKVCCLTLGCSFIGISRCEHSSRSKSYRGLLLFPPTTMIRLHRLQLPHSLQSKTQKKFPKKSALSVKHHSPCCFTTHIYAGCGS